MKWFFILTLTLSIAACKQKPAPGKTVPAGKDSTTNGMAVTVIPPDSVIAKYPYLGKDHVHGTFDAYIDTFSTGGVQFRVVHYAFDSSADRDFDAVLERRDGDEWQRLLNLTIAMHMNYAHTDVNNDGFIDFLETYRYNENVHFYKPALKCFDTANVVYLPDEWGIIDTAKNIYYDNDAPKGNEVESSLFTFNGFEKQTLYKLEFDNKTNDDGVRQINSITLTKPVAGYKDSTGVIRPVSFKKDEDFDCEAFWKANYKALLGY